MLTIVNPMTVEGFTVYHDDENEIAAIDSRIDTVLAHDPIAHPDAGAVPKPAKAIGARRFYVLPGNPTLAVNSDGKPYFSLIIYRLDQSKIDPDKKNDVGGGILTFTAELTVPDDKLAKIKSRLRSAVFGDSSDPAEDVEVTVVEFIDGKVSVAVAGDDPIFVKAPPVGTGKVSGIGGNRKAVMVSLTQAGAALFESLEKIRTLPINIQYELDFEYRLLGVRMRVWCDVTSSYHLLQSVFHESHAEDSGYLGLSENQAHTDKVTSVTELFVRNKTAGVEVIPESSQIPADQLDQMQRAGQDMLSKELDKIQDAKPPPADMDRTWLDKYFSDMSSQLNITVDRRMVLTKMYNPSVNLDNVLRRDDAREMVRFVDLTRPEFAVLRVPIRINADFTRLPLSSVTVTLAYKSRNPDGTVVDATESFDFGDGTTVQNFLCYANTLGEVEYEWHAVVHYKDSQEPFTIDRAGEKARFLVVDVGTMGLIAVDIGLGLVDLDKFPMATVHVRYQSRALGRTVEQTFKLDKEAQKVLWTDIIREPRSGPYEYKVDWLRKADETILEGTWQKSDSIRLRLDAPVPDHLSISVLCTGNFKDPPEPIASVAVALRYEDLDNSYVQDGSLIFTDDKQQLSWSIDLRNGQLRDYKYRYVIVYRGGREASFPANAAAWLPGTPGFLVVGENYGLEVSLYPYLLNFTDRDRVVQVDLTYSDPEHHVNVVNSFVFNKDNNKQAIWHVRTAEGGPKTYSYSVTWFNAAGEPTRMPTQTGSAEALLVPPAPALQPH